MAKKQDIKDVLKTASDRLYPEKLGLEPVTMDSENCDGDTPLHVFIWAGETEKALRIIKHGANINAAGDMGETPLHVALHQSNRLIARALLAAGARTDIVSEFGETALDLAFKKGIDLTNNA